MPSMQNSAPGAKSSKITGLDPFAPFLTQPGDLDGDDHDAVEQTLTESMDRRLRIDNSSGRQNDTTTSSHDDTASNQQMFQQQQQQQQPPTAATRVQEEKKVADSKFGEDDSDFDSDFEDDFEDDPALEAFRERRLAELRKAQIQKVEDKAKGHGEVRTITQDEFLPECISTTSKYVCVHFFHKEFERCHIMDHHLRKIAPLHLSCKFLRIDSEKAPFFVAKLKVQTLPTLLVFRDGEAMDRLTGFDGLAEHRTEDPDEFPTSRLGRWLEKTGALEYEGPDSEDEDDERTESRRSEPRNGMLQSRFQAYDEDF